MARKQKGPLSTAPDAVATYGQVTGLLPVRLAIDEDGVPYFFLPPAAAATPIVGTGQVGSAVI